MKQFNNTTSVLKAGSLMAVSLCITAQSWAFNSEEHKVIADTGASRVNIPASVSAALPAGIRLATINKVDYQNFIKMAKSLAVGFQSNDTSEFTKWKTGVQDNCYFEGYKQSEVNKEIWIPSLLNIPDKNLIVTAHTNEQAQQFTFGELVALYGDYRRTTSCTAGKCYLTHANVDTISFEDDRHWDPVGYCPDQLSSHTYLRYIASGVNPPFGDWGNITENSVGDNVYDNAGWWGDEMLRLANDNDWHFSTNGIATYIGLHRIALHYVDKARKDPAYWHNALHYEANALHSLTDFFAFGHIVKNRDHTAQKVLEKENLLYTTPIQWQKEMIRLGGAKQNTHSRVVYANPDEHLPAIGAYLPITVRNDFLKTFVPVGLDIPPQSRLQYQAELLAVKESHDFYNNAGAKVQNLEGDVFKIYGDGQLYKLFTYDNKQVAKGATGPTPDNDNKNVEPVFNAVAASVQSLFNAYTELKAGKSIDEIGKEKSVYFKALRYLPYYIMDGNTKGPLVEAAVAISNVAPPQSN